MLIILHVYLAAFLSGKALGIKPPLRGYLVEDIQWEVPLSLDGRTARLNGTVQQVYRQVLEMSPSYEAEFGTVGNRSAAAPIDYGTKLEALEDVDRNSWSGCGRFDPARAEAVWEGINHLNHVAGRPAAAPGPGVCGRVSCSYDSAIWWCNDKDTKQALTSFNEIGGSVKLLIGECTYWSDERSEPHISGQQSHNDKWRTIVREAAC